MNILPYKLFNNNHSTNNFKFNNYKEKIQMNPPLSADKFQFCGAMKVLTNECDKAFVNILSKEFDLDENSTQRLKNTVWNFLKENKAQSLGELGGDEHFDEQYKLHEKIMNNLKLSEDKSEYLADEIVHCCDDGDDYIPLGTEGFGRHKILEDLLRGEISVKQGVTNLIDDTDDDYFYQFAGQFLRLTPEKTHDFRKTVDEFLKENNFKSIRELFLDKDNINEQAVLIEKLEDKFNLTDNQSTALDFEFENRAHTNVIEGYQPMINPFVSDYEPLSSILAKGGYNYDIGKSDFEDELFDKMCSESSEKGYKSIFEIFEPDNNPNKSQTYEFIMQSELTHDQKMDLLLDLIKGSENIEEIANSLKRHISRDQFYANIQTDMITEKVADTFGFEDIHITGDDENIPTTALRQQIIRLFPEHVEGGKGCSIKQVAFEIADQYDLPAKAEKKIENIINDVFKGGTREADKYYINKLTELDE